MRDKRGRKEAQAEPRRFLARLEPRNLSPLRRLRQNHSCPPALPSPLPSDGRGEGQGEVRVDEKRVFERARFGCLAGRTPAL
jgi:hypothetical protein